MSTHADLRPPTQPEEAVENRSLLADTWATVSTGEFAGRVLVTATVTLAVGWLGIKEAVGAVIASQFLTEAIQNFLRRRRWSVRRIWLVTLLLLLLQFAQRAWAAVSHRFGRTREGARTAPPTGWRGAAIMGTSVAAATVAAITVPELAIGHSLVGDRDTTFFSTDQQALALSLPHPETAEATGRTGARVRYSATANRGVVRCEPPSGSVFPFGTSTVRCTVRAGDERQAGTFAVLVADREEPQLRLPPGIEREILGTADTITFAATARDRVDGRTTVRCSPESGAVYKLGPTTVQCSTRDSHGNHVSKTFVIDLKRVPAGSPIFNLPGNRNAEATGPTGATVTYFVSAKDRDGRSLSVNCLPRSGSLFAIGTKTVTCSASVPGGDTKQESFDLTVRDTTRPTITVPTSVPVEADSKDGAIVTYSFSASDLVSGDVPVRCEPASGTRLSIGSHSVTCTANDEAGNEAQRAFQASVFDGQPTVIVPSDITLRYARPSGRAVKYAASATDRIDGRLRPDCSPRPGSLFPLGPTTVTCSVTDSGGNSVSKSFTITIVDQTPPVLSLPADFTSVAPSGSKTYAVPYKASAADAIDGPVSIRCKPPSGSHFVVGKTRTVFCSATDRSGNTVRGSFDVKVEENPVD